MNDTTLSEDLDVLLEAAKTVWERACRDEEAAWSRYRVGEDEYRQEFRAPWHEARQMASQVGAAVGVVERACKSAANMTAGTAGSEATP